MRHFTDSRAQPAYGLADAHDTRSLSSLGVGAPTAPAEALGDAPGEVPDSTSGPPGPHGGQIISDSGHDFEVAIDRSRRTVDVYALRSEAALPPSVSVRLFGDASSARAMEVTAARMPDGPIPHYQGRLGFESGSFVGIQLSLNLDWGSSSKHRQAAGRAASIKKIPVKAKGPP